MTNDILIELYFNTWVDVLSCLDVYCLRFHLQATPAGSMAPPHPSYIPPGVMTSVHHSKKQPMVYQTGQPIQTAVLPPQPQPTFSADDYAQVRDLRGRVLPLSAP